MSESTAAGPRADRRRTILYAACPVAAAVIALLLWRGCRTDAPPRDQAGVEPEKPKPLFVPRELAAYEGLDRDGVIAYCRGLKRANYEGILRGAHGALWAGEANEWDRVLLAAEALRGMGVEARVVVGTPPRLAYKDGDHWATVRLDVADELTRSPQPPEGSMATTVELATPRPALFHGIRPAVTLTRNGKAERIEAMSQLLAEWVYRPAVLSVEDDSAFVLRVGGHEVLRGPLDGVTRATLELTWEHNGRPQTYTRELFDAANAGGKNPGHDAPRVGDKYAIVLAAGPLDPRVLETRVRMLESPDHTPIADAEARKLVNLAVKYQVDCDERTRALAAETGVEVSWEVPRITIAASEVTAKGEAGLSLDALADAVEVKGEPAREFHVARGMANDLIETRVIFEATRVPVISASTVFSNFKASTPDAPARRVALIESEAKRLLAHELVGASVRMQAGPPLALPDEAIDCPPLSIVRTKQGLAIHGLAEGEPEPGKPWTKYRWDAGASAPFGDRAAELAGVVDALMCRQVRRTDFMLTFTSTSAWPLDTLPVVAGSVLTYTRAEGKKEMRHVVRVGLKDGAATDGIVPLAAGWPEFPANGIPSSILATPNALDKADQTKFKVRVGDAGREVAARKLELASGGYITLLDSPTFPLVLSLEQGGKTLTLVSASPVVQGRVRDRETGAPAPARVSLARASQRMVHRPQDLRGWKAQGVDANHAWRLAADGRSVEQAPNGSPTVFVGPEDGIDVAYRGTIEMLDGSDDDYVGLVMGYRTPIAAGGNTDGACEAVIFAWKKGEQTGAPEGFTLARLTGKFAGSGDDYKDFWELKSRAKEVERLAVRHGTGKGWKTNVEYEYEVNYRRDGIRIAIDGKEVFNVKGTFAPGRFGFYNYSQPGVRYTQKSAKPEPEEFAGPSAEAPVAADGTYALPVAAMSPRLVLILDRSGSMHFDLNPKRAGRDEPGKPGEQRMDYLKKEVRGLLDRLPADVEVALWSFSSGPLDRNPASPGHCREDCPFTTDRDRARRVIDALKPDGGTPITGAVVKLLEHVKADALSRDAVAILLTDGQNDSRDPSAPEAYRRGKGRTVIHTVGFAIEPGSKADAEMKELARVSGGTNHFAGTGAALKLAFDEFRADLLDVRLSVKSTCHAPAGRTLKAADLGAGPQDFDLTHGCAGCRCEGKTFLTVTDKNVADLAKCEGLTPKARALIEERVKDGTWSVTIPTSRVNVGPASAYGWFETEQATGRLVGRTEDGLHGSLSAPGSFPAAAARGAHAFLTWYEGIVNYTIGSVDAGLKWHRQPGFMSGGPEEFKRFVQANALAHAAKWWNEFGWNAYPESVHAYWTGVCLNYTLQSMAMQMPGLDCYRHWGEALCNQLGDKIKSYPDKYLKPDVFADDPLAKSIIGYAKRAKEVAQQIERMNGASPKDKEDAKNFSDGVDKWKKDVFDGKVDKALDCERFRR